MFPSPIETERLILRRPMMADALDIYTNYASNPRVTRYLCWPTHRSVADAERFLRELSDSIAREEQFSWTIVERDSRWLCGMIGVMISSARATIGYCLAEEVWGAGYASEATAAIVPLLWQRPEIERLEAYCHLGHLRSARVLEKAGLRYIGIDREHSILPALGHAPQDMLRYGIGRPKGLLAHEGKRLRTESASIG